MQGNLRLSNALGLARLLFIFSNQMVEEVESATHSADLFSRSVVVVVGRGVVQSGAHSTSFRILLTLFLFLSLNQPMFSVQDQARALGGAKLKYNRKRPLSPSLFPGSFNVHLKPACRVHTTNKHRQKSHFLRSLSRNCLRLVKSVHESSCAY